MQSNLIIFDEKDEPAIAGTGVSVVCILEGLDAGSSIEQICTDCRVTREQVHAAISYAERNLPHSQMDEMLHTIADESEDEDDLDYNLLLESMC